jgi:hypothetical protein
MHNALRSVLILTLMGSLCGCATDSQTPIPDDGAAEALVASATDTSTTRQADPIGPTTMTAQSPPLPEQAADQSGSKRWDSDVRRANREALAKQLVNPISDLVRLPVRFDYDEGFGPEGAGRYAMSLQPVIPIRLGDEWNLITRTNVPLVYREPLTTQQSDLFGLGDVATSMFFCPQYRKHIWGIGPAFLFPTATDDSLGAQKWAAGPNLVGVRQEGPVTGGFVLAHLWSFAGSDNRREINLTSISPFIAYTTPNAFTVQLESSSVFDWTSDQWLVPIELSIGKVTRLRDDMVNVAIGARYYVDPPDGAPEWGIRLTVTYLFPR